VEIQASRRRRSGRSGRTSLRDKPTWHLEIAGARYDAITAGDYEKVVFDSVIATSQYVMIADDYNFTNDGNEDNQEPNSA
jgi:hypothetical protein